MTDPTNEFIKELLKPFDDRDVLSRGEAAIAEENIPDNALASDLVYVICRLRKLLWEREKGDEAF